VCGTTACARPPRVADFGAVRLRPAAAPRRAVGLQRRQERLTGRSATSLRPGVSTNAVMLYSGELGGDVYVPVFIGGDDHEIVADLPAQ